MLGGGLRSGCDSVPRPWEGGCDKRDGEWLRLVVACEPRRCSCDQPGSVPAGWLRWAETVLLSKTDWRRVLAAEPRLGVERVAGMVDYSYRRPSCRAGSAPDVIFPSLVRPVSEVAVVCDTSGSMSAGQLGKALVEVEALLRQLGLRNVSVLACDAAVRAVSRVTRASDVLLAGEGGTDMGEGIARALALRPRPSVVVVLTDGYTPWPSEPVRFARVIVGLIRRGQAGGSFLEAPPKWARTVHLDIDCAECRRLTRPAHRGRAHRGDGDRTRLDGRHGAAIWWGQGYSPITWSRSGPWPADPAQPNTRPAQRVGPPQDSDFSRSM